MEVVGRDRAVPVYRLRLVRGECSVWSRSAPVGRMLAHLKNVNVASTTGPVLLFGGQARQIVRSLCSRVGYIRDQVYPRWIHHQRVPQHLDTGYQESDAGERSVFVAPKRSDTDGERWLRSLLRSDRACR
jgi:hypothetical protein